MQAPVYKSIVFKQTFFFLINIIIQSIMKQIQGIHTHNQVCPHTPYTLTRPYAYTHTMPIKNTHMIKHTHTHS